MDDLLSTSDSDDLQQRQSLNIMCTYLTNGPVNGNSNNTIPKQQLVHFSNENSQNSSFENQSSWQTGDLLPDSINTMIMQLEQERLKLAE